jgi:hypothetical protein
MILSVGKTFAMSTFMTNRPYRCEGHDLLGPDSSSEPSEDLLVSTVFDMSYKGGKERYNIS